MTPIERAVFTALDISVEVVRSVRAAQRAYGADNTSTTPFAAGPIPCRAIALDGIEGMPDATVLETIDRVDDMIIDAAERTRQRVLVALREILDEDVRDDDFPDNDDDEDAADDCITPVVGIILARFVQRAPDRDTRSVIEGTQEGARLIEQAGAILRDRETALAATVKRSLVRMRLPKAPDGARPQAVAAAVAARAKEAGRHGGHLEGDGALKLFSATPVLVALDGTVLPFDGTYRDRDGALRRVITHAIKGWPV